VSKEIADEQQRRPTQAGAEDRVGTEQYYSDIEPALRNSIARLAARESSEWHAEQSAKREERPTVDVPASSDLPLPAVVVEIEQALLGHFPEIPTYAAQALAGDVFEEVQDFHQWKVHPFPDQRLLPPSMRRGPAPPWPGEPGASHRMRFRLVHVAG
jgi:hypothetical protein